MEPAVETLVTEHLNLARNIAGKEARMTGQDQDDLLSWAFEGLVGAARTFDPASEVPFKYHAMNRIYGAIRDGRRSQDHLSRHHRRQVNAGGRLQVPHPLHFDAPTATGSGEFGSQWETLPGQPDDEMNRIVLEAALVAFMEALRTVRPRYFEVHCMSLAGATRSEVGKALGVTEARISQMVSEVRCWARRVIVDGEDPMRVVTPLKRGRIAKGEQRPVVVRRPRRKNLIPQIIEILERGGGEMADIADATTIPARLASMTDASGAAAVWSALNLGVKRGIFELEGAPSSRLSVLRLVE